MGRSRRLTLNYRTTQQNLAYAVGLLKGASVTDIEGEQETVSGYTSSRAGPAPLEQAAPTSVAELDNLVAAALTSWTDDGVDMGLLASWSVTTIRRPR